MVLSSHHCLDADFNYISQFEYDDDSASVVAKVDAWKESA